MGTMSCFILISKKLKLLVQGNIADSCHIDNQNDINKNFNPYGETDSSSRLNEPPFEEVENYNFVSVPNIAYEIEIIYNDIYLLSTT